MFRNFWHDFKAFAVRGNMIDLAVGVVIGAAFNSMIDAIVTGLISPPLGYLTGGINMADKAWTIVAPKLNSAGQTIEGSGLVIRYGLVLETAIDFFIMAMTIFVAIRFLRTLRDKAEDEADKTVPTPKDIELLAEIRDAVQVLASEQRPPTS